jgi:hypothetical protein
MKLTFGSLGLCCVDQLGVDEMEVGDLPVDELGSTRMRQQNNHLAHEIQTLFFLQPLFKPLLIKFILTTKRWLLGYEFL